MDEKKRRLRIKRRSERLICFWQIVIFSSISGLLGLLFLSYGWSSISTSEIQIKGNRNIKAKLIVDSFAEQFPQPLLAINPKKLETILLNQLPLDSVSVSRRLSPPSIEIQVFEKEPIAFAMRRGLNGNEQGMLDENGYWIPMNIAKKASRPSRRIFVEGWMPGHRKWISILLKNRYNLGSPLKKIILTPNGEINIQTSRFEMVQLGSNTDHLQKQIKALVHLSKNLPEKFLNQSGIIVDIKDPLRPELQMSQPQS